MRCYLSFKPKYGKEIYSSFWTDIIPRRNELVKFQHYHLRVVNVEYDYGSLAKDEGVNVTVTVESL